MKIEKLIEIAIQLDDLPVEVASEIMNYGIVGLMTAGASHTQALDILEKAEISVKKNHFTKVTF